jgi:hypothetical protein
MGCNSPDFIHGGEIIGAEIQGGTADGLELTNARLKGPVSGDDEAWASIAAALERPLDEDAVAAVFLDSLGNPLAKGAMLALASELAEATDQARLAAIFRDLAGADLSPGTNLATRADLEAREAALKDALREYIDGLSDPDAILGHLKNKDGLSLASDVRVLTWDDFAAWMTANLSAEKVAGIFLDGLGNRLVPGTRLALASELEAAEGTLRDALRAYVEQLTDPVAILGQLRSGADLPLGPGSRVTSWQETLAAVGAATAPAVVAAVFRNADGDPLSPGTRLLSMAQTETMIKLMLCEAGASGGEAGAISGDTITNLKLNGAGTILTITVDDAGGSKDWELDVSGFARAGQISAATPVLDTQSQALPLAVYGANNVLLGGPAAFEARTVNGTRYLVPMYADPTPT